MVSPGYLWKNDRGVMWRLRVKPGGWVWKCAQEWAGVVASEGG